MADNDATAKTDKTEYKKSYYVTPESLDTDLVSFKIAIFFRQNIHDLYHAYGRIMFYYNYASGLTETLNIFHEDGRIRSTKIPTHAVHDFENTKLRMPLNFGHESNALLKTKLEFLEQELCNFILSLKEQPVEDVMAKYTDGSDIQKKFMAGILEYLAKYSDDDYRRQFNRSDRIRDDHIDDEVQERVERVRERDRLTPVSDKYCKITKLGSRTQSYKNEKIDRKDFYDEMGGIWRMDRDDADFYYVSNSIIRINSTILLNPKLINFRPICSKFEYRYNKASTRNVIKMQQIEQPLIINKMIV